MAQLILDSATGSPTATLLRLHHGREFVCQSALFSRPNDNEFEHTDFLVGTKEGNLFEPKSLPGRDGRCVQGPTPFTVAC